MTIMVFDRYKGKFGTTTNLADPALVDVSPHVKHSVSPLLYSIFFETEINFGGEGGLYAELIRNRDFEALGRGRLARANGSYSNGGSEDPALRTDPHEPDADPTSFAPWAALGNASLSIGNASIMMAPFATNPHFLRLRGGEGGGASNPGPPPRRRGPAPCHLPGRRAALSSPPSLALQATGASGFGRV